MDEVILAVTMDSTEVTEKLLDRAIAKLHARHCAEYYSMLALQLRFMSGIPHVKEDAN